MRYGRPIYFRSFELGKTYLTYIFREAIIVKFIKVTPKGFNLLNVATNKCILKSHLYSKDFSNKEIPNDVKIFKNIAVPDCVYLTEIKKEAFNEI